MSFFKRLKRGSAAKRLNEELLYGQALVEIESGQRRDGLWAKALANAAGDEKKAQSMYLKYRVQSMIDEAEIVEGMREIAAERAQEEEKYREELAREVQRAREAEHRNDPLHIAHYRPIEEFSKYKGVPEEKIIGMIREGFYDGRLIEGAWRVHTKEFDT